MRDIGQEKGITGQVSDFGQALFHSAIENPVNGITQIINHSTGSKIPELEIAGAVKEPSIGAMAGTIAGGVIDFYILSKAFGGPTFNGFGGQGITGSMLRAGIVGGLYTGVLNPSDPNSETFFKDRLTNGAVGAVTFAAMAAGGEYLARSGKFAVPELRSLSGSIGYGALTGAAGGVAQAEADALFRKHQLLPDAGDLLNSTLNMAAFGAAFAAVNYGYNKAFSPLKVTELNSEVKNPTTGQAEKVNLKLYENASGEVIRLRAELPTQGNSNQIGWESSKMTNGTWSDVAKFIENGKWTNAYDSILVPRLTNLSRATDGSVKLETSDGQTRIFKPDGEYQRVPTKPAPEAPKADPTYSEYAGKDGSKGVYSNQVSHFEFKPESGGSGFSLPRTLEGLDQASSMLMSTAKFNQLTPDFRYLRTDAQGNVFIKPGYSTINGKEGAMAEVPIKLSDNVKVNFDIGDRAPEWVSPSLSWSKSLDGKLQLNGVEIKPNSIYSLKDILLKQNY